ncbi:lectin-like [Pecten maximus]|uniref:lectin-like n=1 Tax=Pecten maximus TaxID=6579 RepID=UPI00145808E8|nr:lectin-like [Pecten maximus]
MKWPKRLDFFRTAQIISGGRPGISGIHRSIAYKEENRAEIMTTFVIKHQTSGKFIHPQGGSLTPCDETALVLHQDVHSGMHFAFDATCNGYGYIRHVGSGKCIHPKGGASTPCNETELVLNGDRHNGALFCIDTCNKRIQHHGGKYIHPQGGQANPCNDTKMVLHGDCHDNMKLLIVSPSNTCEEICP